MHTRGANQPAQMSLDQIALIGRATMTDESVTDS